MKVLFLTNLPSPYRVDFFNELGKYVELTVLFERKSASDRDDKWRHDTYANFKAVFLKGKDIGSDSSIGFDALKYLKRGLFDIVVIADYASPAAIIAILYCRLIGLPYIISSDGAFIKEESAIKRKLKRILIGGAIAWLCTGKTSSEYLRQYGAKEDRIYIYPFTSIREKDIISNPLQDKEKAIIKKQLGISEDRVVLSVGRFIHSKGYDILLNACKNINDQVGIYIVGGIPSKEYMDIKHNLGLNNVHFIDFKSKKELDEYYCAANVFVLPTRSDVWGLVINEAMAKGLPVITTDQCIAGLELIQNGINGYIVPVEDVKLLAEKINFIINSNNICNRMGMENISIISLFTVEKMAERHNEVFNHLIENSYLED